MIPSMFALVILQTLVLNTLTAKYKIEKSIRPFRSEICSMNDQLDMKINRLEKINKGKGHIMYLVEVLVSKAIQQLYAVMRVERCTEADVPKSCEHFLKLNMIEMCSGIYYKVLETAFYKAFQPNLSCPVKPGYYKLKNMTTDESLSVLERFITPDSKYYWKFHIKILDGDKKIVYCMKYTIKVEDRRVKMK